MEKKITKRDNFNEIIKIATELNRKDLIEFATHEIELLDRKKSNDTKTKVQVENEGLKNVIVDTLTELGKFVTITELQNANEELAQLSNQKISALLKQLFDNKVINKKVEKKKAYFGM
jgi:hypothetical protein